MGRIIQPLVILAIGVESRALIAIEKKVWKIKEFLSFDDNDEFV
jgi:hypothetical protein